MTEEAQRIAIAEAVFPDFREAIEVDGKLMLHQGEFAGCPIQQECPDYHNDLNACHEMEKVLTVEQRGTYAHVLLTTSTWTIGATAAQRAEAFLRTIGKWVD